MKAVLSICTTLLTAAALSVSTSASTTVDLQGETFTVDTLRHYKAGPGMFYSQLRLTSQSTANRAMNVFVIDTEIAQAQNIDFRVGLGNDSIHTVERISSYATRHSNAT